VRAWVEKPTAVECLATLDEVDVPCAKVQNIGEVLADPQIRARGMVVEQEHPVLGRIRLGNLPFHFSDCDTTITTPAPLLGQHNREVAARLGYSPEEVDTLVSEGVLYAEAARQERGDAP
jgi:crotonobetainyl-CoA:carnitine CoA-transferase CaiB-like acyl-CoA transferase